MKPFAGAALVAAMLAIVPATAQANTARRHSHIARVTYKVKVKAGKPETPKILSAAGRKALRVRGCLPPIIAFTRVDLCLVFPVTVTVTKLHDGAPVGDEIYEFGVQTEVFVNATSTKLDLNVTAVGLTTTGDEPELVPSITISSQCDHPCQTTTPQLIAIGTPELATGSASNEVTTHPNQVAWPGPAISLYADFGGDKSGTVSWPIIPLIRCDHLYPTEWRKPGCVFPLFFPTADMSGLTTIAKNIRKVQGRGNHVGKPGGSHPLHRASDAQQVINNRNQVCPKHKKRPPGFQCDEYPFASAWEGGKKLPPIDRIADWVPKKENQRQGVILSLFYRVNRIMRGSPGDAFDVRA